MNTINPIPKLDNTIGLPQVEAQVTHLFEVHQIPALPYHNLKHARQVVEAVLILARHYKLDQIQTVIVGVAAWFHDTGLLFASMEKHEGKSIELATAYLQEQGIGEEIIAQVQGCIRATKLPQSPHTLLEEIVCDAVLFHLGLEDFEQLSKLLREEKQLLTGAKISGSEWRKSNIDFLKNHHYFTSYAHLQLEPVKKRNLLRLQEKQAQKEQEKQEPKEEKGIHKEEKEKHKDKKEKKKKLAKLDRDITTLFRITCSNHINLGEMADRKARIMISVNSILVSVIVSLLVRRLHENNYLIIPTILFLLTGVVTIIYSILAARPSAGSGLFNKEDIEQQKGNLLFFGNYYKMPLEDYKEAINSLIRSRKFMYGSLMEDIYRMGVLLGHKYRLLRIAYNVFMVVLLWQ